MSRQTHETVAYWLGVCDASLLAGVEASAITAAMAYQYDMEEQAERIGKVVFALDDFRPVAPVQLTRGVSPLPEAAELLGTPDWESAGCGGMGTTAFAYAWRRPAPIAPARDGSRLRRLLSVAVIRAREDARCVLLATKPGWSYEYAQAHPMSAETRRLMVAAGFAVSDRTGTDDNRH